MQQPSIDAIARANTQVALAAAHDLANFLLPLPKEAWSSPTGCAKWNILQVALHVGTVNRIWAGAAAAIMQGKPPSASADAFQAARKELEALPPWKLADDIGNSARQHKWAAEKATAAQLEQVVELPRGKIPWWVVTGAAAREAVLHHWDARIGRNPEATVRTEWAAHLAQGILDALPNLANQKGAAESPGVYLLQVGDAVGPVNLTVKDGKVTAQKGAAAKADVAVNLTADQYVRLLWGRLDLAAASKAGKVTVTGDAGKALHLNRVFQGV